ncbi:unnamed protein product [Gongylonema pulchrum]|uniref:G_PROTEIN_RECEP_F1_2 domain-containing protein n=1 Tax=Gongylonema pulchrum TaxID=637853 RepID=A0A183CV42_9BILA|nr:unnamed protein product [Gongylonema pulchrum]
MNLLTTTFYIFIVLGMLLILSNGYFAYILISRRMLLRRYCTITVQCVVNAAEGVALLTSGAGRLIIMKIGYDAKTSKRICMFAPWNLLFIWTEPMQALSLLLVGIDRFIAIFLPILYFRKHFTIQIVEVRTFHGFFISNRDDLWCRTVREITFGFSWKMTSLFAQHETFKVVLTDAVLLGGQPELAILAFVLSSERTMQSMMSIFTNVSLINEICASTASVLLYIIVFIKARRFQKTIKIHSIRTANVAFERRQLQLTGTMCISCVLTTVLFVIPACARFISFSSSGRIVPKAELLAAYATISCNLNPFVIVVTIFVLQEDIRKAVLASQPQRFKLLLTKCAPCKCNVFPNGKKRVTIATFPA